VKDPLPQHMVKYLSSSLFSDKERHGQYSGQVLQRILAVSLLLVLTQNGFDIGKMVEGIGNAGFDESGLPHFLGIQFVAGRFICLTKPIIQSALQVNAAVYS
jgi:hypothetical protein